MLLDPISIGIAVDAIRTSGKLAYEYHPFRNYLIEKKTRITEDNFYIPEGLAVNKHTGQILHLRNPEDPVEKLEWETVDHVIVKSSDVIKYSDVNSEKDTSEYIEENTLGDLDSELFHFDLNHPVEMEVLPSYDGSVNIILNDDKNITRLINSRFSAREKDTYEIVDRVGESDTNIYRESAFDKDTSLYFQCSSNPIITFNNLILGDLPVGLYFFYIAYCDADENESDIVAESLLIPVYIGQDASMDGGIKNLLSHKGIKLTISNIDSNYNFLRVYYFRYFADYLQNRVGELKKIVKKYSILSNKNLELQITGLEETEELDSNYINISKFNSKSVLTLAQCKNMLFFGNIERNIDNYKELSDCALRIIPSLYYKENTKEVGYLNEEFYRFGVVFIYNNGTLSNVYNTLGGVLSDDPKSKISYTKNTLFTFDESTYTYVRNYITSDLDGFISNDTMKKFFSFPGNNGSIPDESDLQYNSKGVCKMFSSDKLLGRNKSLGVKFNINTEIYDYLKELDIRGMFFVRQKRIPEVIALCMLLPMDASLEAPVLPVKEGDKLDYWVESFVGLVSQEERNKKPEIMSSGTFTTGNKNAYYLDYFGKLLQDNYNERLIKYNKFIHPGFYGEENGKRYIRYRYNENSSVIINKFIEYNKVAGLENTYTKNVLSVEFNTEYVADRFKAEILRAFGNEKAYIEFLTKWELNVNNLITSETPINNINEATDYYYMSSFISKKAFAGICPDFLLNQPYYNQIFNSSVFKLKKETDGYLIPTYKKERFYTYVTDLSYDKKEDFIKAKICSVTENVNTVSIENLVYKLNIGTAESILDYGCAGDLREFMDHWDTNVVRGIYSPYLAIYCTEEEKTLSPGLYSIYLDGDETLHLKFFKRINSHEPYYTITDRISLGENEITCFNGDCYYNSFTHRLNRNFNDPSMPNNDIVLKASLADWIEHIFNKNLSPGDDINSIVTYENADKVSRADTNAVRLGSWITIDNIRSSYNYDLRSEDHSYVSEEAMMGSPRTYYPRVSKPWLGVYKMPDSYLYNDAFRALLGPKCYFTLDNLNYIKNRFSNRILYSEVAILDSFKNNYRSSLSTYFRDYSIEYGSIQRLIGFEGYLLVIFEHAIGIAVINERILSGLGEGEPVFINTHNVLPEELTIISDTYGTLWPESVVKSEAGYIYGVDTIAKKIWRIKGKEIELISDFKVNEFLVDNITLSEREKSPTIGLRNVKTHYNNNKKDIMFTFYDDVYKLEEKVWNLCYNELLELFITFYSWVPSYSANIDTQFFSFDRNTSKNLALLHKSNFWIPDNYGVLLSNPLIDLVGENKDKLPGIKLYYREKELTEYTFVNQDGSTYVKSKKDNDKAIYCKKGVKFKIEHDCWGNYTYFKSSVKGMVGDNTEGQYLIFDPNKTDKNTFKNKIIYLYITPYIEKNGYVVYEKTEIVALTLRSNLHYDKDLLYFKNDFYLHGNSGIIDIQNSLKPCYWYDHQHPFEFEFVVNDKINYQKIFSDLIIISNKAEPESFHFEIEGDNYEFSNDKRNMYFRLEATKNLYLNLGSNILFDKKYTTCAWDENTQELYYRANNDKYKQLYKKYDKVYPVEGSLLVRLVKSTIFPLYYERVDTYDEIYHNYLQITGVDKYDFKNLSGSEIKWSKKLNQFNIVTHIKNSPIDRNGRLRGNSRYKEGKWHVQIPSITFMLKNEKTWPAITDDNYYLEYKRFDKLHNLAIPPIVISRLPNDLTSTLVDKDYLPDVYYTNYDVGKYIGMESDGWTLRKETKIRDKWIKIRIRYSGKNLAVIHSVMTLYNVSFS